MRQWDISAYLYIVSTTQNSKPSPTYSMSGLSGAINIETDVSCIMDCNHESNK